MPTSLSRFQKGVLLFGLTMVIFTLMRAVFFTLHYQDFAALELGGALKAFITGLRFDASIIGRLFALPLLLLWFPIRFLDGRWWVLLWGWLLYAITALSLLLLIGDTIYYPEVQRHLAYELQVMQNDWPFLISMAVGPYGWALLHFVLFLAGLAWVWQRVLSLPTATSKWAVSKYVPLVFLLVIVGRGGPTGKLVEIIDAYKDGNTAYGNLALNGVFTATAFALNLGEADHKFMTQEKALTHVSDITGDVDKEYPMLRRYEGTPNKQNVVFFLLESWNFDHVDGLAGTNYGVTPNFDALIQEGMVYTRFYAAGQRSIEGIQSTLTSIPMLKGMPRIDTGMGVSNISRLGHLVKDAGYSTLFIQSSSRDSYKMEGIAAATGFEYYYGSEDVPMLLDYADPDGAIFGWDYETLQFMKQKIDELPKPFLSYVFTGTTHGPHQGLPPHMHKYPNEPEGENGYLNSLAYADWSIGEFMKAARKQDWFDDTIFIFTADHTNRFQRGTEGIYKRFHIPFLIYSPKHIAAGESQVIGSQLDVLPTIVDLLGINGEFAALGESLLRKEDGGQAFISVGGQQIGLITPDGFLKHDLTRLLENYGLDESQLVELENRLLAMDQLTYQLLQKNRWAK